MKEKYIDKAQPIEEILKQDITDLDGTLDGKPSMSVIGGWFG